MTWFFMFDFGFPEFLLILIVGLIAVGPKDIPSFLFKAGRLVRRGKMLMRRANDAVSDVMHELEVEEYRKVMKQDILDFGGEESDIDTGTDEMKPLPKKQGEGSHE